MWRCKMNLWEFLDRNMLEVTIIVIFLLICVVAIVNPAIAVGLFGL
jgi:hypothetical protein